MQILTSRHDSFDKILANGVLKSCTVEKQYLLSTLTKAIIGDWQFLQPIEVFGRGGPAPGAASGGGYWSLNTLLGQQDARLLVYLLESCAIPMQKLNCALTACLILGPGNTSVLDKLLKVVFQVHVLILASISSFGLEKDTVLSNGTMMTTNTCCLLMFDMFELQTWRRTVEGASRVLMEKHYKLQPA